MPPKKGLSRDGKLAGMQALMMESNDIWTLKDLEKECPKRKQIIAQSVKEILQELCDSDLVSSDKIGSGKFFWCFPADALHRRSVAQRGLEEEIAAAEAQGAALEAEVARLRLGREDSAEREALDAEISALAAALAAVRGEAAKYERLNPEGIKRAERQAIVACGAANRWTDNVFAIKTWCMKNFSLHSAGFDEQFGLGEGFDYV
jgi:hypothetical protein